VLCNLFRCEPPGIADAAIQVREIAMVLIAKETDHV
jgi:hypothetical protein